MFRPEKAKCWPLIVVWSVFGRVVAALVALTPWQPRLNLLRLYSTTVINYSTFHILGFEDRNLIAMTLETQNTCQRIEIKSANYGCRFMPTTSDSRMTDRYTWKPEKSEMRR